MGEQQSLRLGSYNLYLFEVSEWLACLGEPLDGAVWYTGRDLKPGPYLSEVSTEHDYKYTVLHSGDVQREIIFIVWYELLKIQTTVVKVKVRTASVNSLNNSTFCPHTVFMCFVWVWEQTAIISLYNINWLGFVTEI